MSKFKHANYNTLDSCNGVLLEYCYPADTVSQNALATSDTTRNVGSWTSQTINIVSSTQPGTYPGTECIWDAPIPSYCAASFRGWTSTGAGGLSYVTILYALGLRSTYVSTALYPYFIEAPTAVPPSAYCLWIPDVYGGTSPYTYEWWIDDDLVATTQTLSTQVGTQDFIINLVVRDTYGVKGAVWLGVTMDGESEQCEIE